jgi:DNA-binding response OmpR family regulator
MGRSARQGSYGRINVGRLSELGTASERLSALEGLGFCRILRSDEKLKTIPILVTVAAEDAEVKMAFRQIGASDVVVKPFTPVELATAIRRSRW